MATMSELSPLALLLVAVNLLRVQTQTAGTSTRYWDCCKPSCSWNGKAAFSRPVLTCAKDGVTAQSDVNLQSGCNGGPAYTCNSNQPWALNNDFSLGFAALKTNPQNEGAFCCACYELTFTSRSIAGKKMVVQVTNTGYDLGSNHFDINIPGGGVGEFNGCSPQWGLTTPWAWGQRYGGIGSAGECSSLPSALQPGCYWRFNWFQNADNPDVNYKRVKCPVELTSKTQCIRNDENTLPPYTLPGGSGGGGTTPGGSISWSTSADGIWAFNCDFASQDLSNVRSLGSECSAKCKQTSGCTHYTWTNFNGGTCWMKRGARFKQDAIVKTDSSAVCGINNNIVWNGDWASGCDFTGNDLSNAAVPGEECSRRCAATSGCSHYAWTKFNGGTCWMKTGTVTKANAFSTFDNSMVCGVLFRGSSSSVRTWTASTDGISAPACDFPNQRFKTVSSVTKGNCSKTCTSTTGCTHWFWNSFSKGTCYMKNGTRFMQNAVTVADPDASCGINKALVWNGDWASGCGFVGNDIATVRVPANQCARRCANTTGCTHYAWTSSNNGTCMLKRGTRTKADAVPNFNQTTMCGLMLRGAGTSSLTWRTSADGIWSTPCDFPGQDLANAQVPGSSCSTKCKETPGCTHYAWTLYNGGTCWMKSGARYKSNALAVADPSAVCGINKAIVWNGNTANGCDFPAKDLSNAAVPMSGCASKCSSTAGCTHFAWTSYNGGTCWMKKGGATKVEAIATFDQNTFCGLTSSSPPPPPSGRAITVTNNCPYSIWMLTGTNPDKSPLPDGAPVQLNAGASKVYSMPSVGWAGRMWPKFGCDSNGNNCAFGQSSPPCPSTGCQPPADTKVEFNMPPTGSADAAWYDVSLVDGYSLPVKITPTSNIGSFGGSCIETTCNLQLSECPSNENFGLGDLRVQKNGQTVGCLAPCKRWNYPSPFGLGQSESLPLGQQMCCPHPVTPETCRVGPVINTKFVNLVHQKCPTAYSYSYDDLAGLHNCPGQTGFAVTFCP